MAATDLMGSCGRLTFALSAWHGGPLAAEGRTARHNRASKLAAWQRVGKALIHLHGTKRERLTLNRPPDTRVPLAAYCPDFLVHVSPSPAIHPLAGPAS